MGNSGSYAIGFILAAMPFSLERADRPLGVYVMALALWFFLADGTFTLFLRALNKEAVWRPHKTHLYQRLVHSGLSHHIVVLAFLGAALPLAFLIVWAVYRGGTSLWIPLVWAILGFGMGWIWYLARTGMQHPHDQAAG